MTTATILHVLAVIAAFLFIRFWLGAFVNNLAAQRERLDTSSVSWLRRINPLDDGSYSMRGRQLMVAARRNVFLGLLCGSIGALAVEMAQRLAVSPRGSNLGNVPLPVPISGALVILFLSAVIATIGLGHTQSQTSFLVGEFANRQKLRAMGEEYRLARN